MKMKNIVIGLALIVALATKPVMAQETASSAATTYLVKYLTIKKVLTKYNAPLASEAKAFTNTCIKYNIDCYLLPAISGLESGFGRYTAVGSHNPFGWGGGYIYFESWSHGIDRVGSGIKTGYYDRGLTTPYLIGPVYAESPTWAARVSTYVAQFQEAETETKEHIDRLKNTGLL